MSSIVSRPGTVGHDQADAILLSFLGAIHKARPDVIAAVHCHSVPSKAFSSLGIKLDPINQDACRYVVPL